MHTCDSVAQPFMSRFKPPAKSKIGNNASGTIVRRNRGYRMSSGSYVLSVNEMTFGLN